MDVECWHFHYGDSGHKVTLRHSLALNKHFLIVDGVLVKIGSFPIMQRSFQIECPLSSGSTVISCVGNKGVTMTFTRTLKIDGVEMPSLRSLLRSIPGAGAVGKGGVMFDTKLTPNVGRFRPMRVGITDFHTIEEDEKKTTVYQLFIEPHRREGGPISTTCIVERRFSEFVNLDSTLRLALGYPSQFFADRELVLPPKVYNPLVNQASTEFLAARLELLNKYLCRLLESIDYLMHIQEIYTFFGLSPVTGLPVEENYQPGGGLNTLTPSKLPSLLPESEQKVG